MLLFKPVKSILVGVDYTVYMNHIENVLKVMLENDPNANLNREVPVTPTKPKPATHCQKFIARVLPELEISCFEIKSKDWQAIGELQGMDSFATNIYLLMTHQ